MNISHVCDFYKKYFFFNQEEVNRCLDNSNNIQLYLHAIVKKAFGEVSLPYQLTMGILFSSVTYPAYIRLRNMAISFFNEETFIEDCKEREPIPFFTAVIKGPVIEELVFRGIIESALNELLRDPVRASVTATLLFGVVHLSNARLGNRAVIVQSIFGSIKGLELSFLSNRFGISSSIAAHITHNFITFLS